MYWKSGKIAEENIKATEKWKFQYFIFKRAAKIIKLVEIRVASFRKLFIFYTNRNNFRDPLKNKSKQPTSEDTSFPGLFFTKSEGKQPVC